MRASRFATYFFVCVIAVSSFLPRTGVVQLEGDVNGDGRVDILDLQLMVSSMLSADDIQRPLNISILDLQKTFDQTGASEEPVPTDDSQYVCKGILSSPTNSPFVAKTALHVAVPHSPPQIRLGRACRVVQVPVSVRTERYMYRLTPNAPPVCG